MDRRRSTPYAKTYAFLTEGSSALATEKPSTTAGRQPLPPPKAPPPIRWRAPVERGLRVPAFIVWLSVAGVIFVLAFASLHMRSAISGAQKQVAELDGQLARAEEINQALEVKIATANDPQRIHVVATNWLKMRIPHAEEVRVIPYMMESPKEMPQRQMEGGGLFRQLLSFLVH